MILTKISPSGDGYDVWWPNGAYIGQFLLGDDGYYNYWPEAYKGGYYDEGFLYAIADQLKELNREWDQQVQNDPAISRLRNDDVQQREPL